jgi:hypothetical protein
MIKFLKDNGYNIWFIQINEDWYFIDSTTNADGIVIQYHYGNEVEELDLDDTDEIDYDEIPKDALKVLPASVFFTIRKELKNESIS